MSEPLIPHEFALVAACCRWPQTDDVAAAVRRLSERATRWDDVARVAERHRVAGLVHHALHQAGVSVPHDAWTGLTEQSLAIARQNLTLAAETVRLQQRLEGAGIPVLALKGLSLAQRAYGTIALKHGRDIDLLLAPEQAFAALRLLEQDGYALVDPAPELSDRQRHAFIARGHELEVVRATGARVELHWRLSENRQLLHGLDPFSASQTIPLAGAAVRTLGDADLFSYLCVHGAIHFWFRLKWLADLEALLGQASEDEIERYYRYARAHGAGLCAAQALLLCEVMFDRALPARLRQELQRDRRVRRLVGIALSRLSGTEAAPVRHASDNAKDAAYRFLLGRGMRFQASEAGIVLVARADVLAWQLPRPLTFLYPLIRLPSWLVRRFRDRALRRPENAKERSSRKARALR